MGSPHPVVRSYRSWGQLGLDMGFRSEKTFSIWVVFGQVRGWRQDLPHHLLMALIPKPEPFSSEKGVLSWAEISGRGIAWHTDPCCTRGTDACDWALYTQNSVDIHISDFSSTRVRHACPWTSATTQQTSTTVLFIQYSVFFQRKICHLLLLFVYYSNFYSQVPACCRKCRGYVATAHG